MRKSLALLLVLFRVEFSKLQSLKTQASAGSALLWMQWRTGFAGQTRLRIWPTK
jgi:hypothetical protein